MTLEYKSLVNKAKTDFKKELESIMPEVKLGASGKFIYMINRYLKTG